MSQVWTSIESVSQLKQLLDEAQSDDKSYLILKHSNRCAISSMAKKRLESNQNPTIFYHLIDVISHRNVSNELAEIFNVKHESPQVFLIRNGELIDNWSHMDIRPTTIQQTLDSN